MALINCPECMTQVSDKAGKCPKCAYPINPSYNSLEKESNEPNVIVKSKEGCFLQTLNTGCIIVAFIIGLIILLIIWDLNM